MTESKNRATWNRPLEFLLNVIGYLVGLGNVWRFPYLCYKNGGGAFLIPYLILHGFCGLPLLFMEISMGQYTRHSGVGAWDMVPIIKGVGFAGVLLSWYYLSYVLVIMGWTLFYLIHSFGSSPLPWSSCDNAWNTNSCVPAIALHAGNENATALSSNSSTSTKEFFEYNLLRKTEGIHDMGSFTNWRMILCFLASWIICYLCVLKGIRTSGKVAYVTVLAPYVMLLILLFRGATLDGAGDGVMYYISPRLDRLLDPAVWLDAGGQVLYTLGVCYSVLYSLGSYNKFHTDCYKNAFICVGTCAATSVLVGFVLFSYLGHMAFEQGKNITEVAVAGPGLVFEVFPAGLSLLPLPQLWSAIFFLAFVFIAIDTAFGTIEGFTGVLEDIRPKWFVGPGKHACRLGMCVIPFLLGIPMLFDGGIYVFELVNWYGSSGICVLLVALVESIGLGWIYGVDRFFDNVEEMIGYRPGAFFKYCYLVFDPVITAVIFVAFLVQYSPMKLGDYVYPVWANAVGWLFLLSVIAPIPIVAVVTLMSGSGSFAERWKYATASRCEKPDSLSDNGEAKQLTQEA